MAKVFRLTLFAGLMTFLFSLLVGCGGEKKDASQSKSSNQKEVQQVSSDPVTEEDLKEELEDSDSEKADEKTSKKGEETQPKDNSDKESQAQDEPKEQEKPHTDSKKESDTKKPSSTEEKESNESSRKPDPRNSSGSVSTAGTGETKSLSAFEKKVVELVNKERAKQGLRPLKSHVELSSVARKKSADMRDHNYFSHNSPTYGSPFDMMKRFGIKYRGAGENIAAGQATPEAVMKSWMNSSGHRANILNPDFTHIGVGYVKGGSYGCYWTQQFITK
ncbi:CAP domain-containing protein [Melghirimyces algeriensis]